MKKNWMLAVAAGCFGLIGKIRMSYLQITVK